MGEEIMQISAVKERIDKNSEPLQSLVDDIVGEYCSELDDYMKMVDNALCSENPVTTSAMEDMLLNLNSLLYWVGNGLEVFTLKESIAKLVKEEKYNQEYAKAEGTIGDKTAQAKLASQEEELTKLCYTNAVKLYQHKIDQGREMASSLKKIITQRISETELSRMVI